MSRLFLIFFLIRDLAAQNPSIRLETLSYDEGISYQTVSAMMQDADGFLWIGTISGLVRYDGYRPTVFRHDPKDPASLSQDDVTALFEDRDRAIWVGTYAGGVNRFDPHTRTFRRFVHDPADSTSLGEDVVTTIAQDQTGRIWIGTRGGGLYYLDPVHPEKGFHHLTRDPKRTESTAPMNIEKVLVDRDGEIWIGGIRRGLARYVASENRFRYYALSEEVPTYHVYDILEKEDRLWLATNRGIRCFDKKTLRWLEIDAALGQLRSTETVRLADDDGRLWIGTNGQGLCRYDPGLNRLVKNKSDPADPFSIKSDVVTVLTKDRSGLIWVGSAFGGLQKNTPDHFDFNSVSGRFSSDFITAILPLAGGAWIGHNAGMEWLPIDGRITKPIDPFPAHHEGIRTVTSFWNDPDGVLWVGTLSAGFFKYENGRWKNFNRRPGDTTSLSSNMVSTIFRDRQQRLWIGTLGGGLNLLDERTGLFRRFTRDNFIFENHDILCLNQTSDSGLWVGTYGGLLRIPTRGQPKLFRHRLSESTSLSHDYVYALCEDRRHRLWVGTNYGLCRFDPATESFEMFTTEEGLPNNVVLGIVEDPAGRLWLSTEYGIACFDTDSRTFRNYTKEDGLQGNMFNRGVYANNGVGTIYFGGIRGVTFFDPSRIKDTDFSPSVRVVGFRKFDRTLPLPSDRIALDHDDNFVTIEFAALDFFSPIKNQFKYRLDPLEKSWNHAGTRHEASYTNLTPGTYRFIVQGTNHDGVWSRDEGRLIIDIRPPFWQTGYFIVASVLAALGFVFFVHHRSAKNRVRRALELERVRIHERDRMREQISRDFHDELGHKLTKISLFSELSRQALPDHQTSSGFLDKVSEASRSLSVNTRDFIWALDPEKDTLYDVLINLRDFGYDLFDRTGVGFKMEGVSEVLESFRLTMDWRRHLTLIFKEAMTNALKHARCRTVILSVSVSGTATTLTLCDDGRGFDTETTDESRNGLKNMFERATRLNGRLSITSDPGRGTTVRFDGDRGAAGFSFAQTSSSWLAVLKGWFV